MGSSLTAPTGPIGAAMDSPGALAWLWLSPTGTPKEMSSGAMIVEGGPPRRRNLASMSTCLWTEADYDVVAAGARSASSVLTRSWMSSRIRRTVASGWPAGSSSSQSRYRFPG